MGVCPQFDILWSELTGLEHMLLYGSIKVRTYVADCEAVQARPLCCAHKSCKPSCS